MPYKFHFVLLMTMPLIFSMCTSHKPLPTVEYVDIEKYSGQWYDVASFPQRFQKGCHNTTAVYTLSDEGYVVVENRCNKDSLTGKLSSIKGKAFIVPNTGNAKLEVQFFWPFRGKYWIIDLADDYSHAVVGHPNRKYLWILSRTKIMDENTYTKIKDKLTSLGFDVSLLVKTIHS